MAEQLVLDLVINNEDANTSISEMKNQIKELKSAMLNLDPNSEEFARAAEKAGQLADNIDDAGEAMNSMKGQGTLEGVNSSLGRMDEKMKNLDFDGIAKDIGLMATSISNIKLGDFTKGIQSIGTAFGKLGTAIITNPIFILAAAIAAVTAATILYYNSIETAKTKQEVYNDLLHKSKAAISENLATLQIYTSNLKKTYGNQDEFNKAVKDWNDNIAGKYTNQLLSTTASLNDIAAAAEIARQNIIKMGIAQAAQSKVKEIFENNFDALLKYEEVTVKVTDLEKKRDELQQQIAKKMKANKLFATTEEFRNLADRIQDLNTRIKSLNETGQLQNTGYISPYFKQGKEAQKTINDLLDIVDKYTVSITKQTPQIITNTDEKKKEVEIIDKLIAKYYDLHEAVTTIEARPTPDLTPDPTTYAQDILLWDETNKTKLWLLKEGHKEGLIAEREYRNARNEIWSEDLENYRAINTTMSNISSSFFEFLGNLSEGNAKRQKKIAKVAFGVNKATSAIETAINTSQAVMKIAATTPPPFSLPLQILTGIQGAAQITAILSKKFPENGDSGSVSNSSINAAATTATPSNQTLFSSGGGTPSNITPFANQQMTQKVYVLESDITSTQANVQKVQVQSVF